MPQFGKVFVFSVSVFLVLFLRLGVLASTTESSKHEDSILSAEFDPQMGKNDAKMSTIDPKPGPFIYRCEGSGAPGPPQKKEDKRDEKFEEPFGSSEEIFSNDPKQLNAIPTSIPYDEESPLPMNNISSIVNSFMSNLPWPAWIPPENMMPKDETEFRLVEMPPKVKQKWCPSSKRIFKYDKQSNLTLGKNTFDDFGNDYEITIQDWNGTLLFRNVSSERSPITVRKSEYCVFFREDVIEFHICERSLIEGNFVQKCCAEDAVLDASNPRQCIKISEESRWHPVFYKEDHKIQDSGASASQSGNRKTTNAGNKIEVGWPKCGENVLRYIIKPHLDRKFPNLQENGTLLLVTATDKKRSKLPPGQFCIDGLYVSSDGSGGKDVNGSKALLPSYSGSEWHQGIIVCADENNIPDWINLLLATVNHTAALFLLITAVVYVLLSNHQNVHGWFQFSYVLSLFFAFSFLAIVQVWSQKISHYNSFLCVCLGGLIHLTFLSAFFWLTSMNFDLWWRFSSGRRSLRRIRSKPCRENIRRFLLFALFSLGIPFLISGCAVALDVIYKDHEMADFGIKLPNFSRKCYFQEKTSQFFFLYLPLGILLFINLLFFASTVLQLRRIHSNTELARSQSTIEDKNGVRLIAKLFIVMGVLWIFEFISFLANYYFPMSETLLIWLFMPTDIVNSLQGIAIFIIFVCKPNVFSQLSTKFKSLKCK